MLTASGYLLPDIYSVTGSPVAEYQGVNNAEVFLILMKGKWREGMQTAVKKLFLYG